MYIIELNYTTSLEEVDQYLPQHRDFLDFFYESGNFLLSGRQKPRKGGVILANCTSLEEVWEILEKDPFYQAGIATYRILEFEPTKMAKGFRINQFPHKTDKDETGSSRISVGNLSTGDQGG